MAEFFKFQWQCLKEAWRGAWTRANETAAVLGGILLFAVVWGLRPALEKYGMVQAPTGTIGVIAFSVASAIACVILSFTVIWIARFVTAPSRLYSALAKKRDSLQSQLTAIGLESPLAYENARTYKKTKKATRCDLSVVVHFKNHGEHILRWRMLSASFDAGGVASPPIPASQYHFVNKGQKAWFNYQTLANVPCPTWPIVANVMFEIEYDNVPSVHSRVSKRIVRYVVEPPRSTNLQSADLLSEER
jgi:hypothetical protein